MPEKYEYKHHEGRHRVYSIVPRILTSILDQNQEIEGIAIGGSYASKKYRDGDDIDVDLLYLSYPQMDRAAQIKTDVELSFRNQGLPCHIRAPLAADSISESMRVTLYSKHLDTPFIVRSETVARAWGLK